MNYQKRYQLWKQAKLPQELREQLNNLTEAQIKEHFYTDLSFGTGGIRGIMGVGTNRFNIYTLRKATQGLANYLKANQLDSGVAIGFDNRKDSKLFAKEAAKVLAANEIKSYLFENLRPVGFVSFAVRHFKASAGIMITASHNPKEYNGYKVYNNVGTQITLEQAKEITGFIEDVSDVFKVDVVENSLINTVDASFDELYLKEVKKVQIKDYPTKAKLVYSPLHGVGGTVIPQLLTDLGYPVFPYEPHLKPNPNFTNTKSANPEDAIAYLNIDKYADSVAAELILATDPDADRLGVSVRHNGKYQLLDGNQIAVIMLYYILTTLEKIPSDAIVYKTNVTTDLIDLIAKSYNVKLTTTLTGFKFIGELAVLNKASTTFLFACEESYGTLIKDFVGDKDAVQGTLLLAEIAAFTKSKGITLIDYLDLIYEEYGYYKEGLKNIFVQGVEGKEKITKLMTYFKEEPLVLENKTILILEDYIKETQTNLKTGKVNKLQFPQSQMLKIIYVDQSWIAFRPSGTEPKLKVYYSLNASSQQELVLAFKKAEKEIDSYLNKLI